jgi:TetR/AcrR family transcriptional regulator, acrAB operon repressor
MRRTKEEAEETRNAILAAAERLFSERGVNEVSLEDIVDSAGLTRGALNWHFQNKTGLLLALLDRISAPLGELANELAIHPDLDPLRELANVTTRALARLDIDPGKRRLVAYLVNFAAMEMPQRSLDFHRNIRQAIRSILLLARKRGQLNPRWKLDTAALTCYGLITGLMHGWLMGDVEYDMRRDASSAIQAFVDSLSRR